MGINRVAGYPAIGAIALDKGDGFRKDGSTLQATAVMESKQGLPYRDREDPPIIKRVREGTDQYVLATGLDDDLVKRLIRALALIRDHGVEVYALLPPFSDEVFENLRTSPSAAGWWQGFCDSLPTKIRSAGIPCIDGRHPSDFGLDDSYMIDGHHAGEVYDALLLKAMIAAAPPGSCMANLDAGYIDQLRRRPGCVPLFLGD